MDIVGALGYSGQQILYFDDENFGYVSGNGICVHDVQKGPREMIWRPSGISAIASHPKIQQIAIATPVSSSNEIELIDFGSQTTKSFFRNPSNSHIIHMCHSYDGKLLLAISDYSDHNVMAWNLENDILLYSVPLPGLCTTCWFNPCDNLMFSVSGKDGLYIGIVNELCGKYTARFEQVDFTRSNRGEDFINVNTSSGPKVALAMVAWLPSNRILIGDGDGFLMVVNAVDCAVQCLGRAADPTDVTRPYLPTCATFSLNNLIIGTSTGDILWFGIDIFAAVKRPMEYFKDGCKFDNILQTAKITGSVTSVVLDSQFETIVASSVNGALVKIQSRIAELSVAEVDNDMGGDNSVSNIAPSMTGPPVAPVESLADYQSGAVICTKCISVPIYKPDHSSKTKVSMLGVFVTAAHNGEVNVWRQPSVDSEFAGKPGIRRASPRSLKKLFALSQDGPAAAASKPGAVTVCTALTTFTADKQSMLAVGSSDGWVEFWALTAKEIDMEDEESVTGPGFFEDDGIVIKLSVVKKFRLRTYTTAVSVLACDDLGRNVAVASNFHDQVFILANNNGLKYDVVMRLTVGASERPVSISWTTENFLWIFCEKGLIFSIQGPSPLHNSHAAKSDLRLETPACLWNTKLDTITTGLLVSSDDVLVLSSDISCIQYYKVPDGAYNDLKQHATTGLTFEPTTVVFDCELQSDIAACCAVSCDQRYFAAGCIDGYVYIWKLELPAESVVASLVNRVKLHDSAVLSMSFSADAAFLMSCSVDGSIFILTIDKPIKSRNRMIENVVDAGEHVVHSGHEATGATCWLERHQELELEQRKKQFAPKLSEISIAVDDIAERLLMLLEKNESRNDIERLPRDEFVVDVFGRDQFEAETSAMTATLRSSYAERNLCQELQAARVRACCYDVMQSHSRRLYPLAQDDSSSQTLNLKFVSSFAIVEYTEKERMCLERVKRLRALEMRSQRTHGMGAVKKVVTGSARAVWSAAVQGCPGNVSWIALDGQRWPAADVIEALVQREALAAAAAGDAAVSGESAASPNKTTRDDDDDAAMLASDGDNEIDENDIFNLLYSPVTVRTQVQKRSQLVLLKEAGQLIRRKFNEYFDRAHREKEDALASIEARNIRIVSILEELQLEELLWRPSWRDREASAACIKISDSEISSRPYETEVARAQRLKEEEERRLREDASNAEDTLGRALMEMMNGTLEVKRDVFAEASSLVKPAWMDDYSRADMSELQLAECDAFDAKFKTLQEEQLKYRKSLEQELKKMKSEIAETCRLFDDKLSNLAAQKVLTLREILSQELYMSRIGLSMANRDQSWNLLMRVKDDIETTKSERNELRKRIHTFQVQVEEVKLNMTNSLEEERNLDKSFKRDIQTLCNNTFDQDTLKVLTSLYRLRSYPAVEDDSGSMGGGALDGEESEATKGNMLSKDFGASRDHNKSSSNRQSKMKASKAGNVRASRMKVSKGTQSAGGRDAGSMGPMQEAAQALKISEQAVEVKDPFFFAALYQEKLKRNAEAPIPMNIALSMESDCPDGANIDQFTWSKMQELRCARIEKEIATKTLTAEHLKMKVKFDALKGEEQYLDQHLASMRNTRDNLSHSINGLESNLEVLVNLRQGQDEVDKDAVVTDYADAMLVPVDVISKFNGRIKELGKDKIGVLSKIKLFRRKINLVDWEADHLGLLKRHYEEYFTDLQLLRVTRELQQVIRDGSDPTLAKARLEKIAARKDFLQKDAETKLTKLRSLKENLERQHEDRMEESKALRDKIVSLQSQVDARTTVRQSRDAARGVHGDAAGVAAKKMKNIVARRQLVDTARAQAEEIDFLKQELDKIRQRTFPSFVRATRKRMPGV